MRRKRMWIRRFSGHEPERMLRLAVSKDLQLSRMLNFCGDNALIVYTQSLNVTHFDVAIANAQLLDLILHNFVHVDFNMILHLRRK